MEDPGEQSEGRNTSLENRMCRDIMVRQHGMLREFCALGVTRECVCWGRWGEAGGAAASYQAEAFGLLKAIGVI